MDLEGEHPGVKASMVKALKNVAPRHLLDTRLNPMADSVEALSDRSIDGSAVGPFLQIVTGKMGGDGPISS